MSEAADAARAALAAGTGVSLGDVEAPAGDGSDEQIARLADLDAEHGADRADAVRSVFRPERIQMLASGPAWARADLDRLVHDPPEEPAERAAMVTRLARFSGTDERFDAAVRWYLDGGGGAACYPDDAEGDCHQPRLDDDLRRIRHGRDAADVDGALLPVAGGPSWCPGPPPVRSASRWSPRCCPPVRRWWP